MEKTVIHASAQTGWMWGCNYSVQSNLQQLVCLCSLVAQVPHFLHLWVEGLRDPSVQCGVESQTHSTAPGVCCEWMWGSRYAKCSHRFQLWPMGKLQSFILWEFLWFEELSYFFALSSWANTIFRYFKVGNLGWEEGSLISVA